MTNQRIRHLPVREDGKLVGIISIGDVLAHRVSEVQVEANVLRDMALAGRSLAAGSATNITQWKSLAKVKSSNPPDPYVFCKARAPVSSCQYVDGPGNISSILATKTRFSRGPSL